MKPPDGGTCVDGGQRLRGCGRDQGRPELETGPSAPAMRLALRMSDSARYIAGVVQSIRAQHGTPGEREPQCTSSWYTNFGISQR
ncbi:hypothetical protein D7U91_11555 [Stenotrophomonas maltophilia]|nr:hypothetical protein [Stenotrophomonas maltophilia]MBA0388441.1 hypothetical protein [Stenotrophomonas maltophilia]MBA0465088.1 hypothetical protein [Stenotrophomonas maltophilia]